MNDGFYKCPNCGHEIPGVVGIDLHLQCSRCRQVMVYTDHYQGNKRAPLNDMLHDTEDQAVILWGDYLDSLHDLPQAYDGVNGEDPR